MDIQYQEEIPVIKINLIKKSPPPTLPIRTIEKKLENIDQNILPIPKILPQNAELSMPKYCVARFCDHSEKYGLGYLLIDGTVGACFNDVSRMVMDPYEEFIHYWPTYQSISPEVLKIHDIKQQKKISILKKFAESLKKTKSMYELPNIKLDPNQPLKHVKYWMRNDDATLFRMEDRDIQVNFNDRTKLIIFWGTKKLMMVQSIKELGKLIPISELGPNSSSTEEKKRFIVAKAMLNEMSGR